MEDKSLVTEQAPPVKNDHDAVWDMVVIDVRHRFRSQLGIEHEDILFANIAIKDMKDRDQEGFRKYNTRLQPFNGRDALIDAYQEFLDGAVYLRQRIYEAGLGASDAAAPYLVNIREVYFKHLETLVSLRKIMYDLSDEKRIN